MPGLFSGISNTLFGKGPSVSTQPGVSGWQSQIQQLLAQFFGGGQQPGGFSAFPQYPGPFAAPLSPLQTGSLASLETILGGVPTGPTQDQSRIASTSASTLTNLLTSKAPQIDTTKFFKSAVADPLTQVFEEQTLPALLGAQGASAGGGAGTNRTTGLDFATRDLERALTQGGSQFAANMAVPNLQAQVQQEQLQEGGLNLAPTVGNLPASFTGANISNLMGLLQAGGVPTAQAQLDIQGREQAFSQQQQDFLNLLNIMTGFSTAGTQNAVVNPGYPGLAQTALGNPLLPLLLFGGGGG